MVTMKPWMKLKFILLISLGGLSIYAYFPFVNGLGCDFRYEVTSGDRRYYSTCHMGWLQSIFRNLKTGQDAVYSGFYGRKGDDVFFIAINKRIIDSTNIHQNESIYRHLFDEKNLYTGKQFVHDGQDFILINSPFYHINSVKRVGTLGWWN